MKKLKIEIGDLVTVVEPGHTYSTHMLAAMKMNADYDPEEYERLYMRDRSEGWVKFRTDGPYKWRWGTTPSRGDICQVIAEWNGHSLIEREKDSRQFIIDFQGLRFFKKKIFLEEDLFEL